jgi:hypothetical protein
MHRRARRIALLLLLAACGRGDARRPLPARHDSAVTARDAAAVGTEVVTERLGSDDDLGVLTLTGHPGVVGRHSVRVKGRELWADDAESVRIFALMQPPDGSMLVVLAITPGGTACDMRFRVLELRWYQPPRITREFGTCDSAPEVRYVDGRLRMLFPGWLPARLSGLDTLPPGVAWPPDELLEYRGGTMATIARGARADRLAEQ